MFFKQHIMGFLPYPQTEHDDSWYTEQYYQTSNANCVAISLIPSYTHTHTHTHTHTRMHACTHTHSHTHTHTHYTHNTTLHTLHYTHTHTYPPHPPPPQQNHILSLIKQAKSGGCMLHTDFWLRATSNQRLTSLHFK